MAYEQAAEEAVSYSLAPELHRKLPLEDIVKSPNIADKFDVQFRNALGKWVVDNYNKDMQSRIEWEQRNEMGMKLALQMVEVKSFPWTNCSNVKFPLITIAALQFLARISILTKGRNLVKMEGIGADVDGKKAQRAKRISTHMSMQLVDEDLCWVDEDEKAKFAASLVGSAFKKRFFDPIKGTNVSEYVPAQNFVVDYYCKSIEDANRATHLIPMNANKIQERVRQGLFLKMESDAPPASPSGPNLLKMAADNIQGLKQSGTPEEYEILEQHNWYDFDGDGYAEPYVMSVRRDTGQLLRVVARFLDVGDVHRINDLQVRQAEDLAAQTEDMKEKSKLEREADRLQKAKDNHIVRIDPVQYFNKIPFIPSPDGGFYGLGFGALLGPINETTNTLINQLIDSGTMSTTAGGFLGRGVKLKGGKTSFDPFEWKPVDSTGDDLRKNIFPLPVREPSNVLFQLLGILIEYGQKIGSATDIMTGVSPGQNTPAETSRNTVEQGMMLFSGIYARQYRAFREELIGLFQLNRLFLHTSPKWFDLTKGEDAIIAEDDYTKGNMRIFPAADPSAVSGQQRKDKATMLQQWANATPGTNKFLVNRMWLEAHEYDNIEQIFPDPTGPNAIAPPANPKVQIEQAKIQQAQQQHQDEMQVAIVEMQQEAALNEAKIAELQAKATKHLAEAAGVDTGHQIAMIEAQIGAAKLRQEGITKSLEVLRKAHETGLTHGREMAKMQQGSQQQQSPQPAAKPPAME
jgi:chaperonin GroES